jgi:hypothetical protein
MRYGLTAFLTTALLVGCEGDESKEVSRRINPAPVVERELVPQVPSLTPLEQLSQEMSEHFGFKVEYKLGDWSGQPSGNFVVGDYKSVVNQDPESFIHKYILNKEGTKVYAEIRELEGVEFLANFPTGNSSTVIRNPNSENQRLVAYREFSGIRFGGDYSVLAEAAKQDPINEESWMRGRTMQYHLANVNNQFATANGKRIVAHSPRIGESILTVSQWTDEDGIEHAEMIYPEGGVNAVRRSFTPRQVLRNGYTDEFERMNSWDNDPLDGGEMNPNRKVNEFFTKSQIPGRVYPLERQQLSNENGRWVIQGQDWDAEFSFKREEGRLKLDYISSGP